MLLTTFKTSFPCVPWALVIVVATVMAGAFADNDEGLLQSVQIEYFKANLLKKLGLVAAPRITRPSVPPPEPLVRKVETENRLRAWEVARTSDDAGDMDDEFVGQHQEHILFPKESFVDFGLVSRVNL
ncbi:hypothetical protein CAPTEDRAFT_216791 [Capitella teleta]|uniref:TGF-beta propeptide domain-containing protein n=1 Tax=Capitella teleta TaxID=283909 RepID=R7UZH0_CAPTE|nr:hypothetical protein CAPTEDRAFT_216791 [Capitella teleta]|eukprot:ELU11983.1 hypothetical protein CAPTEDRAFT_216791 [Capitella teleta]